MPIYEYRCQSCDHDLEVMQKLSDPELRDCPACGKPELKKLISAVGFRLKGSGWWIPAQGQRLVRNRLQKERQPEKRGQG